MTSSKRVRRVGLIAIFLSLIVLSVAEVASASVGPNCGDWHSGGVSGNHQRACAQRYANYVVKGIGRSYFTSPSLLSALDISVQLYDSLDGVNWTQIRSKVCDFTSVSGSATNPNSCETTTASVVPPRFYRARVFIVAFWKSGGTSTSSVNYSLVTT